MCQSLFIVVNDLNDVSKKMIKLNKIDEILDLFEHKTKLELICQNFYKNWDQKGILT